MKLEEAIEICEKNFLVPKTEMPLSEFWKYQNRTAQTDETMPLAYVRKDGRISFNEVAKKFEFIEEIKEVLTMVWKDDHEERIFCLTRSIKELAKIAPNARARSCARKPNPILVDTHARICYLSIAVHSLTPPFNTEDINVMPYHVTTVQ